MILYHGTTISIKNPQVSFSKDFLDFGKGFYLTTFQEQAEKWALRKALRTQKQAVVNVYELSDDWSPYRVLRYYKRNDQICIVSQKVIETALVYKESYQVNRHD